jgi:acyl dehydratase
MPIDRDKALAHRFPEGEGAWEPDDAILYALGVGAGVPQTDAGELAYTYEKDLKVLPSFATVAPSGANPAIFSVPGLSFNPALMLHGEQEIVLHRPLPPAARVRGRARIADVYDKGKAALALVEVEARDAEGPLFTSRMSLFLRGEGGFGGPRGPEALNAAPARAPDGVVESKTLPQQALLYRLCGDKNPLHCDPDFAKSAGFEKPILHGLCSYGIACKAIVDGALGGDVTRVASYFARFRGVAWPGETYLTKFWREGDRILLEAWSKERNAIILANGCVTLRA